MFRYGGDSVQEMHYRGYFRANAISDLRSEGSASFNAVPRLTNRRQPVRYRLDFRN